jgi:hypothetical protein
MTDNNSKIVHLNRIEKASRCAIVPGYYNKKKTRKLKELSKLKGNCLFSSNIAHGLIDFIYRAVVQLKLKDKKLIFSRGAVKINEMPVLHATAIYELDWDVGTSIRIPYKLNYNNTIKLTIDNSEYKLRLMEIIVLSALLHIAYPAKKTKWCSDMSVLIIAKGWPQFEKAFREYM